MRNSLKNKFQCASALLLFALVSGLCYWPFLSSITGAGSGSVAYARHWEMNDAAFMLILWFFDLVLPAAGNFDAQSAARLVVMLFCGGLALWLNRRPWRDAGELYSRCLYIVGAIFLLSPTQYPWYYVWVVPFLALKACRPLLLLTPLLALYYLRFYFDGLDKVEVFDFWIVWLEYLPVWLLMLYLYLQNRKRSGPGGISNGVQETMR